MLQAYHCLCKESLLPAGAELVFLAQTGGKQYSVRFDAGFCTTDSRYWIATTALAQVALCTTCRWKPVIWTLPSYTRQCQKACPLIASAKMVVLLLSPLAEAPVLFLSLFFCTFTVFDGKQLNC